MDLIRSWMFVPGHRQRMIDKALGLNADAIMLDIEDGVAPNEKDSARKNIAESLGREKAPGTPSRYVRINAIGHARMDADLEAVVRPGLEGLVCPKVDTPDDVRKVDSILTEREPKLGIQKGTVKLLIAIESPRGLLNAPAIAASSPRATGLIFGAEDFGREIGLPTSREGEARDLIYARSAIVVAAAAAHVQAVDGVWVDLNDTQGLLNFAKQARQLFRHVLYSPITGRCYQHDIQSNRRRNRICAASTESLRRGQCARRRFHCHGRAADRSPHR